MALGWGVASPSVFALVADLAPEGEEGRVFVLFSCQASAPLAHLRRHRVGCRWSGEGWRYGFYLAAMLSAVAGVLLYMLGIDPRASTGDASAITVRPRSALPSPRIFTTRGTSCVSSRLQ